jgi:hypothetical protein
VQALTATVFPCYAVPDREHAQRVADFLERGADVRVFLEEGEMRPGEDLAGKARQGRLADIILVFFSRDSLPSRWPRAQWEDALINEPAADGVRIGFVRCDDCVPPKVLTPVFDPHRPREIKRWVRRRAATFEVPHFASKADLEWLGVAIADRPGAESIDRTEIASQFAAAFRHDFDEIFLIECCDRSLAALAGDLGAQLGLRLDGPLEQNLERLREFCSQRRFLLLLEGAHAQAVEPLIFGGRCSTLISTPRGEPRGEDPLRPIQYTMAQSVGDWTELCRQARLGRRLTREQDRIAECYELMQQWHSAAEERGDRGALNESARELVWILEGWGRTEEAARLEHQRAAEFDEQMVLPFLP